MRSVTVASDGSCFVAGNNKAFLLLVINGIYLLSKRPFHPIGRVLRLGNKRGTLRLAAISARYEISSTRQIPHTMSVEPRRKVSNLDNLQLHLASPQLLILPS